MNDVDNIKQKTQNLSLLLNYFNLYNWTNDLPKGSRDDFYNILDTLKIYFTNPKILEIGVYTGTSLLCILNYIQNFDYAIAIDIWKNSKEYDETSKNYTKHFVNMEENHIENVFDNNINLFYNYNNMYNEISNNKKNENNENKIFKRKGYSRDVLLELIKENNLFNFIYVDGSHLPFDCYLDLELSWSLLSKYGILAIDDYLFNVNNLWLSPYNAVNHFLDIHSNEYILLSKNYRVFIQKII